MVPVDYSKWDALELSDDSDIEVHPNVDKRSFIRAKQNQIHQQRAVRRQEIETLKYERIINDGLLERINALLDALKKHQDDANTKDPDGIVFQALIESAGDPARDEPPQAPEGVYQNQKEPQPTYSKMMGSLLDQVKKEVVEKNSTNRYQDYVEGVRGHLAKVQDLQQQLLVKLAELEKEESLKITSDKLHDGFNTSSVNKSKPQTSPSKSSTNGKSKSQSAKVELLNPSKSPREALKREDSAISSGAEADVEDDSLLEQHEDDDEEASVKITPLAKRFAKIKIGDYRECLQFISHHPEIVAEQETDGLLVEAFNAQMAGKESYARTCVHQGLLLQYCRQLGRDGIGLFFKRIATKDHQAGKVFGNDVNDTYKRIKTRAAELAKQEKEEPAGVEQIQLHAVDPGTQIHIQVPQANSDDPTEVASREIFERFPPGLQRALETGSLDKINEVLGKMSVEEAEDIVGRLGEGNMLSIEEGVIDATNEEGQQRLKQLETENREGKQINNDSPGDAVEGDMNSEETENLVDQLD